MFSLRQKLNLLILFRRTSAFQGLSQYCMNILAPTAELFFLILFTYVVFINGIGVIYLQLGILKLNLDRRYVHLY
jgi:hypothetical protein